MTALCLKIDRLVFSTMSFERYSDKIGGTKLRSFAMRELNDHETEANKIFWSFIVSNSFASKIARDKNKIDKKFLTKDLFFASGENSRRIPTTVAEWIQSSKEFETWSRRSLLLSAASYLELYIKRVTCSALLSRPMLMHGVGFDFDGMCLIKRNEIIDAEKFTIDFVKGDWSSRLSALIRIFGEGMREIEPFKSDLDQIRTDRNSVSHNFGRDIDIEKYTDLHSINKASGMSEDRLKKYLSVIKKATDAIDRNLMNNHIGAFEVLRYYHENLDDINKELSSFRPERRVQKFFHSNLGISFSQQYAREMTLYYDNL